MENVYTHKRYCSGCGVCAECCPKNAITLKPDSMGYLYPEIDIAQCVDCGLCRKVCHMLDEYAANRKPYRIVALKSKDPDVLRTSQSGGAFAELAKCILIDGGIVYGAAFDPQFRVAHIRIDRVEELYRLQGSKYVQSQTAGIFSQVKRDLELGRNVLFSGTPCQVAALHSFLGKAWDNLFCVDVVCHGVMPPRLWEDYLSYAKEKFGTYTQVKFRDKDVSGWRGSNQSFIINGKIRTSNTYSKLFYSNYFLRDVCCDSANKRIICKYGGIQRCSDLTIGDFWGIEDTESALPDNDTGISLCLINSEKGEHLFEKVSNRVFWETHSVADVTRRNPQLAEGEPYLPELAEKARQEYLEKGFRYIAGKYADVGVKGVLRRLLRPVKLLLKSFCNTK